MPTVPPAVADRIAAARAAGMSDDEIASELGIPLSALRSYERRAAPGGAALLLVLFALLLLSRRR